MAADQPVNITLNTEEFAKKWANVTVDRLHQALDHYNIGKLDGPLWRSLQAHIVANNGDVEKVLTKFLQSGRFLDMRVGRGVPMGAVRRRKKQPWYSKTYYSEVQRFKELYAQIFNKQIPAQIVEALSGDINITA